MPCLCLHVIARFLQALIAIRDRPQASQPVLNGKAFALFPMGEMLFRTLKEHFYEIFTKIYPFERAGRE